ncbi:MAG: DUF3011 domain-containing protein [Rhodanobacteraceae bacterium]|nr:MAG: DUF3011 domain-containing protein [Rhodanobacteraceae bacterium]
MRRFRWLLGFAALVIAAAAGAQVTYGDRPPPLPPDYYPGQHPIRFPPGSGYGDPTISCGSPQYRLARCAVPGNWPGARMVRQTSKARCVQGQTWGFDRGGVWVDKGCGGLFAPGGYTGGGWRPGPGWDRNFQVECGSPQYRYLFCQVDVGARGRVVLQRQISDTRCIEGRNWGWNRAGIWTDKGCGARFTVIRRW